MSRRPGVALAAVHRARRYLLRLLCGPFRADLPHGQLCHAAAASRPMAAVTIYSVEGLAGLGGRLLFGVLADRLGVKPVLVAGPADPGGRRSRAYLVVSQLDEFYALAVVFGAAYGGVMPLYAVLAREYFGQRIMGTVFGAATMVSSLGMALGPLAGGWIFDTLQRLRLDVHRLGAIGLGAALIALAFPPVPSARRAEPQPA